MGEGAMKVAQYITAPAGETPDAGALMTDNRSFAEGVVMNIEIDSSKCQGHALCALMSDDYFTLDDIGHIASTSGEVPPDDQNRARRGVEACPERVFTIS